MLAHRVKISRRMSILTTVERSFSQDLSIDDLKGKLRFIGQYRDICSWSLHTNPFMPFRYWGYSNINIAFLYLSYPPKPSVPVNLTDPVFRGVHHGRKKHEGSF